MDLLKNIIKHQNFTLFRIIPKTEKVYRPTMKNIKNALSSSPSTTSAKYLVHDRLNLVIHDCLDLDTQI